MRDIKFRAYIKDEGRLLNVNLIDFDDEYVRVWDEYGENEEEWFLKDCELMQYTGINGSIWEGGIVRDISNGNAYIVEYNQSQGNFGLAEVSDVRKLWSFYGFGSPGPYKVIGNKFQNPELLEDIQNE